jgi:hypothetical protein
MAEQQFGGQIVVRLETVFTLIAAKLRDDVDRLKTMLETHDGMHDFTESQRLLTEIHAGVRATNILDGKVDATGLTIGDPLKQGPSKLDPLKPAAPQPLVPSVDMKALATALGTVDPADMETNQLTDEQKAA